VVPGGVPVDRKFSHGREVSLAEANKHSKFLAFLV